MRLSTLSCTMVGGLFLGRMVFTSTPSTKSWLATNTWKRCPQFLTHVSKTWRREVPVNTSQGRRSAQDPPRSHSCPRRQPEVRPRNADKQGQCWDAGAEGSVLARGPWPSGLSAHRILP